MRARVYVMLKNGVLDPQGAAIENALGAMGFDGINAVRQGKIIELDLDAESQEAAQTMAQAAAEKLLVNGVIEDYEINVG